MLLRKKAFTLIELLVVIAIIGVLATISVIALSNARAKSRDAKRAGDMKQIQTALELFFNDNNRYPTAEEFALGSIFSTSTYGTSTYMQIIPSAPTPADGPCTPSENTVYYQQTEAGNSYTLSFCLGNTTGSLTAGPKCLTSGGIIDEYCGPFTCGDSISYSGEDYPTVSIGNQCWFAKNLNVGSMLCSSNPNNSACSELPTDPFDVNNIEKHCYYNNEIANSNGGCSADGALYVWTEAMALPSVCQNHDTSSPCIVDSPHQGICPSGWHIPSDAEWYTLELFYSTSQCDADRYNWQCSPAGTALKVGGVSNMNINLSGKRRYFDNTFSQRNANSYLWASNPLGSADVSGNRIFGWGDSGITRSSEYRTESFAVRCIKD